MATIISPKGFKLLILVFVVLTSATIIDVVQDAEIKHEHSNIKYLVMGNQDTLENLIDENNKIISKFVEVYNQTTQHLTK